MHNKFMLSPLRGWDALRYAPAAPNKGVIAQGYRMEVEISKLNAVHLCFEELEPEEFYFFQELNDKVRSGTNPGSLKAYACLVVHEYSRAEEILNQCGVDRARTQLKYIIASDLCWGEFIIPLDGVKLASKCNIEIKLSYATPARR